MLDACLLKGIELCIAALCVPDLEQSSLKIQYTCKSRLRHMETSLSISHREDGLCKTASTHTHAHQDVRPCAERMPTISLTTACNSSDASIAASRTFCLGELPWHALQLLDDFITSMHMAVAILAKHAAYNAALECH